MSFNNFSAPFSWAPIFPQTLNTIPYTPLLSDDRPHENIFGASYGQGFPAPAIPPVQALEALPKVIEAAEAERPAKRQRLLAAASARDGTKVEGPAPASTQRKTRLHIKTSGRSIGRAFHACARCRRNRQACGGRIPICKRCEGLGVPCEYKLTPKQLELAERQAAESADPSVGNPGLLDTAPVRRPHRRRILPHPEARAAGHGGLTAGPEVQSEYSEQPGSSFGGFTAASQAQSQHPEEYNGMLGGFASGPDPQPSYSRMLDMGFGGLNQRSTRSPRRPQGLNGGFTGFGTTVNEFWQSPQVPNSAFGDSDTGPSGYLQYPRQPVQTFGGLGTRYTDYTQRPQQTASEFWGYPPTRSGNSSELGTYPPTPSGPSSASGAPGSTFGGSPAGVSPYARDPAVGFGGRPPSSHGDLPKPPEWRQTRQG